MLFTQREIQVNDAIENTITVLQRSLSGYELDKVEHREPVQAADMLAHYQRQALEYLTDCSRIMRDRE